MGTEGSHLRAKQPVLHGASRVLGITAVILCSQRVEGRNNWSERTTAPVQWMDMNPRTRHSTWNLVAEEESVTLTLARGVFELSGEEGEDGAVHQVAALPLLLVHMHCNAAGLPLAEAVLGLELRLLLGNAAMVGAPAVREDEAGERHGGQEEHDADADSDANAKALQ